MRLRSLRSRTIAAGVIVVALVLGGLDAFVYLSLRQELHESTEALLRDRADLTRSLAQDHAPEELATRLQQLGIRAVIRLPDGVQIEGRPASPALSTGLPPPSDTREEALASASQAVRLPDGSTATVFASVDGADRTLEHIRFLLLSGTFLGVALAALLLRRWTAGEMRPLEDLIAAAHRVAAGERGVRLHPRRTDTEIGHVSLAFDEVTEALEAALDDARRASEVSQTFLADAAHQLRTPITGIRATAEVLAMGLDPEGERRAIELLIGESERVGQLLSGLLRLARLDSGGPPVQEPVDLDTVCRTEVDRIRALRPDLTVVLRSDVASAAPVELDPAAMPEVLANLLDNACRHARRRVEVQVRVVGRDIEIGVSDDGPGLEPADAERAFERFVSLDGDGGSGLGLAIARAIVEANGGTLAYDRGRFVIRLSKERRQRRAPRRGAARAGGPGRGDRRRSTAAGTSGQDLPSPVLAGARSGTGRRHDGTADDAGSDR